MEIRSQEHWILYRLEKFYNTADNFSVLKEIIEGRGISLRLIDWFVTNYAKKYNTSYIVGTANATAGRRHVVVYLTYKSHLKAYSKKMFDPFCRAKRIKFNGIETTVGQLNFFEWALSDNVINYIQEHKDEIQKDMDERVNSNGEKSSRHELSQSANKSLKVYNFCVNVKFD
jgi:hypothetical protein